jgi:hypothetical protein
MRTVFPVVYDRDGIPVSADVRIRSIDHSGQIGSVAVVRVTMPAVTTSATPGALAREFFAGMADNARELAYLDGFLDARPFSATAALVEEFNLRMIAAIADAQNGIETDLAVMPDPAGGSGTVTIRLGVDSLRRLDAWVAILVEANPELWAASGGVARISPLRKPLITDAGPSGTPDLSKLSQSDKAYFLANRTAYKLDELRNTVESFLVFGDAAAVLAGAVAGPLAARGVQKAVEGVSIGINLGSIVAKVALAYKYGGDASTVDVSEEIGVLAEKGAGEALGFLQRKKIIDDVIPGSVVDQLEPAKGDGALAIGLKIAGANFASSVSMLDRVAEKFSDVVVDSVERVRDMNVPPDSVPTVAWDFSTIPADPVPGEPVRVRVRVASGVSGIRVEYRVSGSDGYSQDGTAVTDARGMIVFNVPGGEAGVKDRVWAAVAAWGPQATRTFGYSF